MPNSIFLQKSLHISPDTIFIPGSKSESNRALIISALGNHKNKIRNLSSARDTQTLATLLNNKEFDQNVLDAGTTMRFLTAFYAATGQHKVLSGTARMHERPIKILVEALIKVGAQITYLDQDGYPPIEISGLAEQKSNELSIPGNVSSQYISALLMIAPVLPSGLTLHLEGTIGSRPYIDMTLKILTNFGINSGQKGNSISIAPQKINFTDFEVEPDWSGASYWYAFAALCQHKGFLLKGLKSDSLQGDRVVAELMKNIGVHTEFTEHGAFLTKIKPAQNIKINFYDYPDLAQTIAVVCAVKGIEAIFTGLSSLKIKETDRVTALQNELKKINAELKETGPDSYVLIPSGNLPDLVEIDTYEDHRMAMAFAPLCTAMDIKINNPDVVNKSYPEFWEQVKNAGIRIE